MVWKGVTALLRPAGDPTVRPAGPVLPNGRSSPADTGRPEAQGQDDHQRRRARIRRPTAWNGAEVLEEEPEHQAGDEAHDDGDPARGYEENSDPNRALRDRHQH